MAVCSLLSAAALWCCFVWLAVVPPGYFLPQGASMQKCGAAKFREGWVLHSDPKAETCTPCGDGIDSEPRDLDENPKAANGTLVRATSASCCKCAVLLRAVAAAVAVTAGMTAQNTKH